MCGMNSTAVHAQCPADCTVVRTAT